MTKFFNRIKTPSEYGRGLAIFGTIFSILEITFYFLPWDLRYAIPFLAYITPVRILFIGLPVFAFAIVFFEVDQYALQKPQATYLRSTLNTFWARSWPYIVILIIYYTPLLLGFTGLPDMLGFLTFFIVGFIPVMLALTFITEFPRYSGVRTLTGSIIASGFLSWVLAATLPLS